MILMQTLLYRHRLNFKFSSPTITVLKDVDLGDLIIHPHEKQPHPRKEYHQSIHFNDLLL